MDDGPITPFTVDVPAAEVEDLRRRLRTTRWPDAPTVDDWSQGVPLAYAQELCRYWVDEYDWRATEARLNALPQFRTEIVPPDPVADQRSSDAPFPETASESVPETVSATCSTVSIPASIEGWRSDRTATR